MEIIRSKADQRGDTIDDRQSFLEHRQEHRIRLVDAILFFDVGQRLIQDEEKKALRVILARPNDKLLIEIRANETSSVFANGDESCEEEK